LTDPQLRRQLRRARRNLSAREQQAHAEAVATRLLSRGLLRSARRIALYQPMEGELDPTPIRDQLRARGKGRYRWYLPVLRGHARGRLWFVRDPDGGRGRRNRFGIWEPRRRNGQIIPAQGLHLILVPLVGFDADCHRIGMGAGFYDRSLAFLRNRKHWRRPRLIGLAHECQRVDQIRPEPWDIPLDAIVSERNLYQRRPTREDQLPRSLPANRR
jgi:5-formyltetrahydrofolate cyclo-ligase